MKPQLLKVNKHPTQSFSIRRDTVPYINNRWHYHQEVELVYFEKGHGTQFVGDSIRNFRNGDVVLIGSNLPHYWSFDECYFSENHQEGANVLVIHFNEEFWGKDFLGLPENINIQFLLNQAKHGIQISKKITRNVKNLLEELLVSEGVKRIILLIETLNTIANAPENSILSSAGFTPHFHDNEGERINSIYNYALHNFRRKIALEEIADIAGMSSNAFCRYFKSRTGKTFSQFLIELRIGHACKLLIENDLNVKQICYESGFYNFAGFHKYFKQTTGRSPLNYQKEYLKKQVPL